MATMQSFSPNTPFVPPPSIQSRQNFHPRRVRPSLHPSTLPSSQNTTQQYSSDSDLTLESTLHHLTDFLTQCLPSLGYSREAITILRECIAIHLTPKLAPTWDVSNPSSGCGIRSLIAMPGKFPTPLVNAAKDAGVDVVKWAKGMSPSGEWELWVDPGSICFRDGGWAWVDEGFESRGFKQTLHTIWQTPIVPQTPLGTSSNIPNSSPFTTSHFPLPPNSAPSAPVGSSRLINPKLYTNSTPIRAPAVFRIPPPPLPSSLMPGFLNLSLGNGTPDATPARKAALTAFGSDDAADDDGWGEISQKLGERGALLMDAAMGEGRGLRRLTNAGGGDFNRVSAFGLLPSADISFGGQASKRLSLDSAPGSERSRNRSVSGGSSTGMRSIGGGDASDRESVAGLESTEVSQAGNAREEDGMVFLDTGLMAAIEGSDDELDGIARKTPLPATPANGPRSRDPSSNVDVIGFRHGTPSSSVSGEATQQRDSPSTPQGAGIITIIAETPQSETSDATTIKANRVLVNSFEGGEVLPSTLTNGVLRSRSATPGVPTVQPYDGGNVGVLGGGVKLGGMGYQKVQPSMPMGTYTGGAGSSAAAALAASAMAGSFDGGRPGQSFGESVAGAGVTPDMLAQLASREGTPSQSQVLREGKVGMVYPNAGKKRRGRPTARSTAHAQNGPVGTVGTSTPAGTSADRTGKASQAVTAAIASFEGPGRWTGLPGQGPGPNIMNAGREKRRARQEANKRVAAGLAPVPPPPGMMMGPPQPQPRWNGGPGPMHPMTGYGPILGTGISGQPGSGMVLANMQQHHQQQHQNVMMGMGGMRGQTGWEGQHAGMPIGNPPAGFDNGGTQPLLSPSGGLAMLSPGMSAASVHSTSPGKASAFVSSDKGSVPTAYGVPSGSASSWARMGTLPPPFVPSGQAG